jgi:hypothetical protein
LAQKTKEKKKKKKLHSRRVPQKSKRTAGHVHSTREVQLQPKKKRKTKEKSQKCS